MTTTELIELLKKHERGGATGRPREVMFEVDDRIIDTDGIEVTGSGDGLISELYLSLPSVQPERTCVNCGRTVNNGGWYADGGTRCPIEEHYALPKDGYCHLWEKRSVTDDDYPERRTDDSISD